VQKYNLVLPSITNYPLYVLRSIVSSSRIPYVSQLTRAIDFFSIPPRTTHGSFSRDYFRTLASFKRRTHAYPFSSNSISHHLPSTSHSNIAILGNGPSLATFNFDSLPRDYITLGLNYSNIFYSSDLQIFSSLPSMLYNIESINLRKTSLLVPFWLYKLPYLASMFNSSPGAVFFYNHNSVSTEFPGTINIGETAIDIAVLLGARNILLIGYDGYEQDMLSNDPFADIRNTFSDFYSSNQFSNLKLSRNKDYVDRLQYRSDFYKSKGVNIFRA